MHLASQQAQHSHSANVFVYFEVNVKFYVRFLKVCFPERLLIKQVLGLILDTSPKCSSMQAPLFCPSHGLSPPHPTPPYPNVPSPPHPIYLKMTFTDFRNQDLSFTSKFLIAFFFFFFFFFFARLFTLQFPTVQNHGFRNHC